MTAPRWCYWSCLMNRMFGSPSVLTHWRLLWLEHVLDDYAPGLTRSFDHPDSMRSWLTRVYEALSVSLCLLVQSASYSYQLWWMFLRPDRVHDRPQRQR